MPQTPTRSAMSSDQPANKGMQTVATPIAAPGGNSQPAMPSSINIPSTSGGGNVANPFLQDLATHRQQATAVSSESNSQNATNDPVVVSAGFEASPQSAPNSHKKKSKNSNSTAALGASSSRKRGHDSMVNASAHAEDAAAHIAAQPSGGVFRQPTKYQRILPANIPPNMPANMPPNLHTNLPANMPANMPASLPSRVPANPPANGPANDPAKIQLVQNHASQLDQIDASTSTIMGTDTLMGIETVINSGTESFISISHRNEQARQAQSQGLYKLLSSQIDAHKNHIQACDQAVQEMQAAYRRADAAREWETMNIHSMIARKQENMAKMKQRDEEQKQELYKNAQQLAEQQRQLYHQEG